MAAQGYLAHKKQQPPLEDHHRATGIVLLQGPRGVRFLMREVPLYCSLLGGGGGWVAMVMPLTVQ